MSERFRASRATETKRQPVASISSATVSPLVRAGTYSGGQSLDKRTQSEMAARFGHDFSQVRIHTDARASETADTLGANAFTVGTDIVFGRGHYAPGSADGERLLAHELTHVVQQSQSGPGDWGRRSNRGDESEREAETLATQALAGQSAQVSAAPEAAIACEEKSGGEGGTSLWDIITNDMVGGGAAMAQEAELGISGLSTVKGLGMSPLNAALAPLGAVAGGLNLRKAIQNGEWGEAIKAGLGMSAGLIGTTGLAGAGLTALGGATGSSALATAGGALSGAVATGETTALGIVGGGSALGVLGAGAASGLAGYAGGTLALGAANDHARENVLFGRRADGTARDTTEAAADAGEAVNEAVDDFSIGGYQLIGQDYLGDIAGGATSVIGSWGTAAYSGLHSLVSGPSIYDEILQVQKQKQQEEDAEEAAQERRAHSSIGHDLMAPMSFRDMIAGSHNAAKSPPMLPPDKDPWH